MKNAIAGLCAALLITMIHGRGADAAPPATIEARGNLVLDGVPVPSPAIAAIAARLEPYLQARSARFLDWMDGGGMLVATRFADTEQLHAIAAPLGAREQLTWLAEPVNAARVPQVAGSQGLAFLADQGGDENAQLWFYRYADRGVQRVTDGRSRHGNPLWAHDGRRIAFFGNERDAASQDIYVAEPATGGVPQLVVSPGPGTWYPLDWSPDDRRLLLQHYVSINDSTLFIAEIATGALTPLELSKDAPIGITIAKFAPDGRGIYLVSDQGSEFRQLRYYDPVTRESRLLSGEVAADIDAFDVSADGRYVAFVANVEATSRLTVIDTVQHADLAPPGLPAGVITDLRFDRGGRRLGFTLASADAPRDAWAFDLGQDRLERWTRSEAGPLDPHRFATPELVQFPSWDRVNGRARQIPAFVWRPRGASGAGTAGAGGRHPVLISLHGGPESQYRPVFDPWVQFLVNELGFVVVCPNVRGSSGYGRSYLQLDDGALREDAVRDVGAAIVWAGLQPDLDRGRLFVAGGSYGGYLALAAMVSYGDRIRGGIDVVGISNFVTFLEHTSAWRRDQRRAEYGDERDPRMRAFLQRISPLTGAAAIHSPLLVIAGQNDPRVPASESQQMVYTVRAHGGEVWYLSARNEGHGFARQANRNVALETEAAFLARFAQLAAE